MMTKQKTSQRGKFWVNMAIYTPIVVVGSAIAYVLMLVFVFASFTVPSYSMRPTIEPGDRVLVFKPPTGARLLNVFKAARHKPVEIHRLPGWLRFKRGDVLVFNFVHDSTWSTIGFNWPKYYVKRCVGTPGDTVTIHDFEYYVNSVKFEREYDAAVDLRRVYPEDSIARADSLKGYMVNVNGKYNRWSIREFGPMVIPRKGMTMPIDTTNIYRYKQIIEWESHANVLIEDASILLADHKLSEYTFHDNYYFMAGDNSLNSMDSRYWGLVPEPFIVGKATMIWWSEDDYGVNWNRIFKPL